MLELKNIEFDWLYVPTDAPFMKETLTLWGIDPVKIIQPIDDFHYIEADELIVPSITRRIPTDSKTFQSTTTLASYWTPWVIEYIRNKYLPLAQQSVDPNKFSKRVFISRKDSTHRIMLNEDEVFSLFEQHGFKSYVLGQMSFLEQVALFAQAEIIIGAHGSGLANLIFAKPGTQVIEIFQARSDATECYLAQMCKLKYHAVGTSEFRPIGFQNTTVPISIIIDVINKLFN
jgi:capsular polysaccharide biosynthesis protein